MRKINPINGILVKIFIFCSLMSFSLSFFMPVYTDELGWKFIQARVNLDGGVTLATIPSCRPLAVPIPTMLLPARLLETFIYEKITNPLFLRTSGFLIGALTVLVAWMMLNRISNCSSDRTINAAIVCGFFTIGVTPFLVTMNRPEQFIAIVIIFIFLSLLEYRHDQNLNSTRKDISKAFILLSIFYVLISSHPRSIFMIPLIFLYINQSIRRRYLVLAVCGILAVVSVVAAQDWGERHACLDSGLRTTLVLDNITTAAKNGELRLYGLSLLKSFLQEPLRTLFIEQFQLKPWFTSHMIPGATSPLAFGVRLVTSLAFLLLLAAGVIAFAAFVWQAWRGRRVTSPVLALSALWAFWAASVTTRVSKNDYEAAVMMPVIVLAALGSIWVLRHRIGQWLGIDRWRALTGAALGALIGLSLINQAALLWSYGPLAWGAWRVPGYAEGQRFSVVAFGYEQLVPQILQAGAQCGIDPASRPRHLVVDELTYYAFRLAYRPVLATYIDENGWGRHVRDHRALLAGIGSEGMVAGCQWIPSDLRGEAIRSGQFCCLPAFGR